MGEALQEILTNILPWKSKYGSVYYIKFKEEEYVFRVLSRGEYLSLLSIQETFGVDIGDFILKECILYPKFDKSEFDMKLAGSVDFLISLVSDVSGFSKSDQVIDDIEKARTTVGSLDNQIIILICKAFPHITLQEINNLTYEDLIRYLSISEVILDAKLTIEKPKSKKPGTIDFDEENKVMGATPFVKNIVPSRRGDISK